MNMPNGMPFDGSIPGMNPETPVYEEPKKTPWDIWEDIDIPELKGVELNAVRCCNDQMIIVGHMSNIAIENTDGTWSVSKVTEEEMLDINDISYDPTKKIYVIACACACIYWSEDLKTWTKATVNMTAEKPEEITLYGSIALGDLGFIVVGSNGTILFSADGKTWDQKVSGTDKNLYAVTYGLHKYIATGKEGTILVSTDAETWRLLENPIKPDPYNIVRDLEQIIFCEEKGLFITLGQMNCINRSTDGETWLDGPFGINNTIFDVDYGNGRFVGVGWPGFMCSSEDGEKWGFLPCTHPETLISCAFNNTNKCYVVGENGVVFACQTDKPVEETPTTEPSA